ncbi:MAG: adenylate/guanylate cyclase domain-containing protein [Stappiaceae bacterium]
MTMQASLLIAELMEWLHGPASRIPDTLQLIEEFAKRLRAVGLKVDRMTTAIPLLHPNVRAESVLWQDGQQTEMRRFIGTPDLDEAYQNSPLKTVYTEERAVRFQVNSEPVQGEYGVSADLREAGMHDYVALPMPFSDGSIKGITFATRDPVGFSDRDVLMFETAIKPLALLLELHTLRRTAETVLETYVGKRAGKRVLEGSIRRGDGEEVSALVGFADIRGFTRLSNSLPGDQLLCLLNTYFDAMATSVEACGGEVLKFIGDEVLTVFPFETREEARKAAHCALSSSIRAMKKVLEINSCAPETMPPLRCGIALHAGKLFFGNVGSETRLDFTVVGPTVNLANRLADVGKREGAPIVVSQTVADLLGWQHPPIGTYELRGFEKAVPVYTVPEECVEELDGKTETVLSDLEKN